MDADLPEEGAGEYDPSFVITKLGAKVNRALVGGVIDRVERRETVVTTPLFLEIQQELIDSKCVIPTRTPC